MKLSLINLNSFGRSWEKIDLLPVSEKMDFASYELFETDQIKFVLECHNEISQAKLLVGGAEIWGRVSSGKDGATLVEWIPRSNSRFGYDAFFLNFFGIANFAVEVFNCNGSEEITVFESVNIFGRRVTADRAEAMLSFISEYATPELVKSLSPTSFSSSLVKSGVTKADALAKLERTISDVEECLKKIISRPLNIISKKKVRLLNPSGDRFDSSGIEWAVQNIGMSEDACDEQDGIFKQGLFWKKMPEIFVDENYECTDIYENQIISFYLIFLLRESHYVRDAFDKKAEQSKNVVSQYGDYQSFFNIVKKGLGESFKTYRSRASLCIKKCQLMIGFFNKKISCRVSASGRLVLTEKIKENRHYLNFFRAIKNWIDIKEVKWIEDNFLSSINSIPRLFEYYCVLVVHKWLDGCGSNDDEKGGLFNGHVAGKRVILYYEPSYPQGDKIISKYGIWAADYEAKKGRRPDIVIDVNPEDLNKRSLLILDAKCRKREDVLKESIPDCMSKYGVGLRDERGSSPVKCVIMLYPDKPHNNFNEFFSFFKPDFSIYGSRTAYPIIGAQALAILNKGAEIDFEKLLGTIFTKIP